MNSNLLKVGIVASLGTLAPTTFATAQEAMIDEVFVTGSRIKRADIDGVGKVDVVTVDDFARIGAVSIDQLLKFSPFTGGPRRARNRIIFPRSRVTAPPA